MAIGCKSNLECPLDAFCDFPDNLCGRGLPGDCIEIPPLDTPCPGVFNPGYACGECGTGMLFDNECRAVAAGVDFDAACPGP